MRTATPSSRGLELSRKRRLSELLAWRPPGPSSTRRTRRVRLTRPNTRPKLSFLRFAIHPTRPNTRPKLSFLRVAILLLAWASVGCAASARGALERELVAQRQQIRLLEEQAAACKGSDTAAAVYRELSAVLGAVADIAVTRVGAEVHVRLGWDRAINAGGPSVDAEMLLDVVAGTLARHPDLDAELLVEAEAPTSEQVVVVQRVATVLHDRFAAPWDRLEVGSRRGTTAALVIHFVPRPPDAHH